MSNEHTLSVQPSPSTPLALSTKQDLGEQIRTFTVFFFLGGVLGLWLLSFSIRFFPLGWDRTQALLLCLVYLPSILVWLGLRRPSAQPAPYPIEHWKAPLLALGIFAFWALCYYSSGLLMQTQATRTLHTALDHATPLLPWRSFIYASIQWYMVVAITLIADVFPWRRIGKAYATVILVCTLCFLLFPVTIQPTSVPVIDLSTWVISLIRGGDVSNNCFPSSHCAMALLSTLLLFRKGRLYGTLGLICTLGIAWSTMTTKQHYFADVVGGFTVALASYIYWFKLKKIDCD